MKPFDKSARLLGLHINYVSQQVPQKIGVQQVPQKIGVRRLPTPARLNISGIKPAPPSYAEMAVRRHSSLQYAADKLNQQPSPINKNLNTRTTQSTGYVQNALTRQSSIPESQNRLQQLPPPPPYNSINRSHPQDTKAHPSDATKKLPPYVPHELLRAEEEFPPLPSQRCTPPSYNHARMMAGSARMMAGSAQIMRRGSERVEAAQQLYPSAPQANVKSVSHNKPAPFNRTKSYSRAVTKQTPVINQPHSKKIFLKDNDHLKQPLLVNNTNSKRHCHSRGNGLPPTSSSETNSISTESISRHHQCENMASAPSINSAPARTRSDSNHSLGNCSLSTSSDTSTESTIIRPTNEDNKSINSKGSSGSFLPDYRMANGDFFLTELRSDFSVKVKLNISNHLSENQKGLMSGNPGRYKSLIIEASCNFLGGNLCHKAGINQSSETINEEVKRLRNYLNLFKYDQVATEAFNTLTKKFPEYAPKHIKKGLNFVVTDCLNRRNWTQITTKIPILNQQNAYFENRLTPASEMALSNGTSLLNYSNGVRGASSRSNSYESQHACNLWQTELLAPNNEKLFEGLRHGVLTNLDPDVAKRQEASFNKTEEVMKAALMLKYGDLVNKALVIKEGYDTEIKKRENVKDSQGVNQLRNELQHKLSTLFTKPLDLKLTSTSLMTLMNVKIPGLINEPEKNMNEDQVNALYWYTYGRKTINIHGVNIPVKCEMLPFVSSMNDLAIGAFGKFVSQSAWRKANAINKRSLNQFIGPLNNSTPGGWVGSYLENNPDITPEKRNLIVQIAHEIKVIFSTKSHQVCDDDICKLSKRIAYLSHLIGVVPAFNCKSGKDRTSVLDSEIKAYVANIYAPNDGDKNPYKTMFYFDGSNYKLQELNTGVGGNKCGNNILDYYRKNITSDVESMVGLAYDSKL